MLRLQNHVKRSLLAHHIKIAQISNNWIMKPLPCTVKILLRYYLISKTLFKNVCLNKIKLSPGGNRYNLCLYLPFNNHGTKKLEQNLAFPDSVVGIIGIKLQMHLLILNQFSRQMKYIRGWHDRLTLTEK